MMYFGSPLITTTHRKYNTWCKYTTRLDTYGCGCSHECKYCYAKGLLEFRNNWHPESPRPAYITEIVEMIERMRPGSIVRMGGMSDCFQPVEDALKVTRQTIQHLNKHGIHYLVVTKGAMVARKDYLDIYDGDLAHFQISITGTDDTKVAQYESASPVSERIRAAEVLEQMGFDVSIRLSPLIVGFVDFDVLNRIRCSKILVEFLKVNHWVRKRFDIDYSRHTLKYGGHDNLELEHKCKLVGMITGFEQVSVGEYVKEHYEYFRDNVNFNPEDCCNLRPIVCHDRFKVEQQEVLAL